MRCKGCFVSLKTEELKIGRDFFSCYIECPICKTIHRVKCRYGSGNIKRIKIIPRNQVESHILFLRPQTG